MFAAAHTVFPGWMLTSSLPAGEYAEEGGHPLLYPSLLNHASYTFDAPTPIPKGGTGDSLSPSQQQWAKTSEVPSALGFNIVHSAM